MLIESAPVMSAPGSSVERSWTRVDAAGDVATLVERAGELVGELGLDDGPQWAAAGAAVAAIAVTLRTAAIELVEAARLGGAAALDSASVTAGAPPVVRAREIGFLASMLAGVLQRVDEEQPAVSLLLLPLAERLAQDVRRLSRGVDGDVRRPSPIRHRGRSLAILSRS